MACRFTEGREGVEERKRWGKLDVQMRVNIVSPMISLKNLLAKLVFGWHQGT